MARRDSCADVWDRAESENHAARVMLGSWSTARSSAIGDDSSRRWFRSPDARLLGFWHGDGRSVPSWWSSCQRAQRRED